MKEINELEISSVKQKVFLIGEAANYVDLSFIPNGSVFYDSLDADESSNEGYSIVIVDLDSSRTLSNVNKFLEQGASRVKVVWNPSKGKEYSHSMLLLARESFAYDFHLHGSTARLAVWQEGMGPDTRSPSTALVREALIEHLRTPSPLSMEEGERLIQSQTELLEELENQIRRNLYLVLKLEELEKQAREIPLLTEKVRELTDEAEMLRQKNEELAEGFSLSHQDDEYISVPTAQNQHDGNSLSELEDLREKYRELQGKHQRLNHRYDALAKSKLGALTLKRWERKSKSAGK